MGEDNGGKRKEFSGTTIKDTWTKPRRWKQGREVGMAGVERRGVVRGKCRQLQLNNNKIIFKNKIKN